MGSTNGVGKKHLLLSFILIFVFFTGCTSKSDQFGVIYTNNFIDIYKIQNNIIGSNERLTFSPTVNEYELIVSNNGDEIIFQAGLSGSDKELSEKQNHVYLLNTISKELVDITEILVEYPQVWDTFSMDWSPVQERFLIVRNEVKEQEIISYLEFVDIDGSNREQKIIATVGEIPAVINNAKWSPDGRKIYFTQNVIGLDQQLKYPGSILFVYDLESDKISQLTNYEDHCLPEKWSPDNRKIITTCSSIKSNITEGAINPRVVRVIDVENHDNAFEFISYSPCDYPSWSPEGKYISFVCEKKNGKKGLFVVNSDGNNLHEIAIEDIGNITIYLGPHWSPDGTKILYVAFLSKYDASHSMIYSVNIDGSDNHAITTEEGHYIIEAVYPIN